MTDLLMLAITLLFFIATLSFLALCAAVEN